MNINENNHNTAYGAWCSKCDFRWARLYAVIESSWNIYIQIEHGRSSNLQYNTTDGSSQMSSTFLPCVLCYMCSTRNEILILIQIRFPTPFALCIMYQRLSPDSIFSPVILMSCCLCFSKIPEIRSCFRKYSSNSHQIATSASKFSIRLDFFLESHSSRGKTETRRERIN